MKVFLSLVAIIGVVLMIRNMPGSGSGESGRHTTAATMCQYMLQSRLREPSSAEWVDWQNWPMTRTGEKFRMVATVRARNGFGGMSVEKFECLFKEQDGELHMTGLSAL